MACWSKLPPELQTMPCRTLSHPWTDNCVSGAAVSWAKSFIGSASFFTLLYLFQYASTVLKKKKKANLQDYLIRFVRSTVYGASVSGGTFAAHCFLRWLLGKYSYYTTVFLPACIGGFFIFLEHRKGQELSTNAFANSALELWLRMLEHYNILKWTPNNQTLIFMVISAVLSSLLSCTNFDSSYFWFFIPPKAKDDEFQVCFHKDSCRKHISKLFIMYSTTGLVLQFLGLFMKNLKNPKLFLSSLKSAKVFKLASFLGGYVVIYQAIRCFLYRREKKYSVVHDSLAGFLAGVAFRFQPTAAIFNSAIITTVQILTELACERKLIPNLPYTEITFIFLCGLLFHARVVLGEHCPSLMVYITSTVTYGMSDRAANTLKELFQALAKKV